MANEKDTRRHLVTVHDPEVFDTVRAALSLDYLLAYPSDKDGKPEGNIYGKARQTDVATGVELLAVSDEGCVTRVLIRDECGNRITVDVSHERAAWIAQALMSPIGSELDAEEMRSLLNHLHSILQQQPFKIGLSLSPGGILNAYREGDISFNDAVARIEKLCEDENTGGHRVFFRPVPPMSPPSEFKIPEERNSVVAALLIAIAMFVVMAFGAIAWELLN